MENNPRINQVTLEPYVYSILVMSGRNQVLHQGVYFSLDEAYWAARKRMEAFNAYKPGEAIDIILWHNIPVKEINDIATSPQAVVGTNINNNENTLPVETNPFNPIGSFPIGAVPFDKLPKGLQEFISNMHKTTEAPDETPMIDSLEEQDKNTTVSEYAEVLKLAKNDLMRKLIEEGNVERIKEVSQSLTPYDKRYILKRIKEKNGGL